MARIPPASLTPPAPFSVSAFQHFSFQLFPPMDPTFLTILALAILTAIAANHL